MRSRPTDLPRARIRAVLALLGLLTLGASVWAEDGAAARRSAQQGLEAYRAGRFDQAVDAWERAERSYRQLAQERDRLQMLVNLGEAHRSLGQHRQSLALLESARSLALAHDDVAAQAMVLGVTGSVLLDRGTPDRAASSLEASVRLATLVGRLDLAATSYNNLGNARLALGSLASASKHYAEAARLAGRRGDTLLRAKSLANLGNAQARAGEREAAARSLNEALRLARSLPESRDKAYTLITAGRRLYRLHGALSSGNQDRNNAVVALGDGLVVAERLADAEAASFALGFLAQAYEGEDRLDEALELTRRAAFFADQAASPESLYRWQWQRGRLQRARGEMGQATVALREAVDTFDRVRADLSAGFDPDQDSFKETVSPVYMDFADVLLLQAAASTDPALTTELLLEAVDAVERLKAAELQNYFRDPCVALAEAASVHVNRVAERTAILYPIAFADRLELVLLRGVSATRVTVDVDAITLSAEVHSLRTRLEKRTTRQYLPNAKMLYDWLIRPLEGELKAHHIDTLVVIPGGALLTVPFTALHDGRQHLVERYAVAITPGMKLTDPRPLPRQGVRVLLSGLTESVQGYPGLPNVSYELTTIADLYPGRSLVNGDYDAVSLRTELEAEPYSIVHIASHGRFAGRASESFLLTHDGRISLDDLEQLIRIGSFAREPIELLTLSACQTAVGDERSALGLAGIAVKAGARSALATLWFVNDPSAALLVTEFYRRLAQPGISKAQAMQQAQRVLIADRRYWHPGHWAPYLLIGNWL